MTEETDRVVIVVVGMNRPRLNKIMSLIDTTRESEQNNKVLEQVLHVEIVPCLAAMGSYNSEDGKVMRYMANFVYHDGSSMTQFLDDGTFREQLSCVLLVGYEWHAGDSDQIRNYFQASNLPVTVKCVQPLPGHDSLQSEMEAFKLLSEIEKQKCLVDGSMGPGRMAKFVLDTVNQMKQEKYDKIKEEEAKIAAELAAKDAETTSVEPPKQKQEPIDPDQVRYACRMCRSILFGQIHLEKDHVRNQHTFKKLHGKTKSEGSTCQSIFCSDDVLEWLSPSGQDIEGKLVCPRCSHKIGHWKWAGAQCSCGTWVTPAIQIPTSKVDIIQPSSISTPGPQAIIHPSVVINPTLR